MNNDSQLVPAKKQTTALGPAAILGRLQCKEIIRLDMPGRRQGTIYYLAKFSCQESQYSRRVPASECAMVTHWKSSKKDEADTFTLSYYPKDATERQVVEGLPLSKLADAVNDLVAAGFGRKEEIDRLPLDQGQARLTD